MEDTPRDRGDGKGVTLPRVRRERKRYGSSREKKMHESITISLQVRLRNCLLTILELEPDLQRLEIGQELLEEYSVLRSFMDKLDEVLLEEEDVRRIERATANFLDELKLPLSFMQRQTFKRQMMQ